MGTNIGPNKAKTGQIFPVKLEKPLTDIGYIYVCSVFDGSLWVDKLRTEYTYVPTITGSFGHSVHKTSIYYPTTPD